MNRMGRKGFQLNYRTILLGFIILVCIYMLGNTEGFSSDENPLTEIPFYIQSTVEYESNDIAGVPRILYHSWHSNKVPAKMAENIRSLLKSNAEFDYYLYSDEKSLQYIKDNFDESVISAFETLKPGAYKSDLWRYCILYKTGGVYMDIKYNTVEPLISLLKRTPTIYVRDRDFFGELKCVYNGVMAAPPGNKIFKYCIDDVVNNCKMKLYKANSVDVTGPCVLGRMLTQYEPLTMKAIKYSYDVNYVDNNQIDLIKYDEKVVMKSYPEYRHEQKQFQKTLPYTTMWMNKDIYN